MYHAAHRLRNAAQGATAPELRSSAMPWSRSTPSVAATSSSFTVARRSTSRSRRVRQLVSIARPCPHSTSSEARLTASSSAGETASGSDFTWGAALRTPAFWVFALASSTYNLVASGIGLFNESILAERGFAPEIYHRSLVITALTSLMGNFLGGWLAEKWSVKRLMAIAMGLLAGALAAIPWLRAVWQVDIFAVVMGVAGGFVIVIFFSFWAETFGRAHLGRIVGTAQMLTVLASAVGPLLLAQCHAVTGSYAAVFYVLAAVVTVLGLAAWIVKLPAKAMAAEERSALTR